MRCGSCNHLWPVDADWIEDFNEGVSGCPACGTDCRSGTRPDFWADPDDPAHSDSAVRDFYWYHSSTHENWPDHNFNPAASLSETTKRRMESMGSGVGAVEQWARRQKAKALHIGTYEAAIENMFRRLEDQADSSAQFYIYRVRLDPDCVIEPGVHKEPTNWLGDAYLAEVCSRATNVLRYVNVHEDQSGVSLAIELPAIDAVQRTPIPMTVDESNPWIVNATKRLLAAASKISRPPEPEHQGWLGRHMSPLESEAHELELEIAVTLPPSLAQRLSLSIDEDGFKSCPESFPVKLLGLARLVTDAQATLAALDAQPWESVHPSTRRRPMRR
ncbi:MAG: hypothetical protein NVSMB48_10740 [Marmoricola sp.]